MLEKSIYELFHKICEANRDKVAYRYKKDGQWISITWGEHGRVCATISKSLIELGIEKGDKVNILSQTRLEWVQLEIGIASIGAVTVGIYASNLPDDCAFIVNHSDAVLLFAENQGQLDKILQVRQKLPKLRHIVLIDGHPIGAEDVLTWEQFMRLGHEVPDTAIQERAAAIEPADMAAIVYTSGTTGTPKGAMLSHENFVFTSWSAAESLYLQPNYETLLFLPLAHVYARIIVFVNLRAAMALNFAESIEKVPENLREVRPHFFSSVPRIYEKIYDKIMSGVQDAGGLKAKLFNWALSVGYEVNRRKQAKAPVSGWLALKNNIATKLVFSKIRAAFGGRVVWAISGAAPLNKSIAEFFHACGILILEGIGMTENTSFTNVNRYDNNKFGTVGQPGPGIEQKVAPDGEVLYRGKNVMLGYYKNPEATKETIDAEGWLHTGDIGEIDDEGFLRITDRKKDLIITAGGKNVAPQRVERVLRTSRYISQVVAFGDRKKYLTAIVTLDREQLEAWAVKNGVTYGSWEELCAHEKVKAFIDAEVEEKNRELASYETVKKVCISPQEFTIESGDMTPSMKIKRKVVTKKFLRELEALYED